MSQTKTLSLENKFNRVVDRQGWETMHIHLEVGHRVLREDSGRRDKGETLPDGTPVLTYWRNNHGTGYLAFRFLLDGKPIDKIEKALGVDLSRGADAFYETVADVPRSVVNNTTGGTLCIVYDSANTQMEVFVSNYSFDEQNEAAIAAVRAALTKIDRALKES